MAECPKNSLIQYNIKIKDNHYAKLQNYFIRSPWFVVQTGEKNELARICSLSRDYPILYLFLGFY